MAHCKACDCILTAREDVRKSKATGEELGLCDKCLGTVEEVLHVVLVEDSDELDYLPGADDYDVYHPGAYAEEGAGLG